jgi:putative endonuclease
MTSDLQVRMQNHNSGNGSKYVSTRLPFLLVYFEKYKSKKRAIRREKQLKGWGHDKKSYFKP